MIFLNGDKLKFGIFHRQVREYMLIQKCLFLFQEFRKVDPLREIKKFFMQIIYIPLKGLDHCQLFCMPRCIVRVVVVSIVKSVL